MSMRFRDAIVILVFAAIALVCGYYTAKASELDVAKFKGECLKERGTLLPVAWDCSNNNPIGVCKGSNGKTVRAFVCIFQNNQMKVSPLFGK